MLNMIRDLIYFRVFVENIDDFVTLGKGNNKSVFDKYSNNPVLFIYTLLMQNLAIFDKWTIVTLNEPEG